MAYKYGQVVVTLVSLYAHCPDSNKVTKDEYQNTERIPSLLVYQLLPVVDRVSLAESLVCCKHIPISRGHIPYLILDLRPSSDVVAPSRVDQVVLTGKVVHKVLRVRRGNNNRPKRGRLHVCFGGLQVLGVLVS